MNITPINNNQNQNTFGMKVVKSKDAASAVRKLFPNKTDYTKVELEALDFVDLNKRNIVAHLKQISKNFLALSARSQSVLLDTQKINPNSPNYTENVSKYFLGQANKLTEQIDHAILSQEFAQKAKKYRIDIN